MHGMYNCISLLEFLVLYETSQPRAFTHSRQVKRRYAIINPVPLALGRGLQ